jgi:hypothetical protein
MRALTITVREPGLRPCRAIVICTGNRGGGNLIVCPVSARIPVLVPVGAGLDPPAVTPSFFAERSRPFPTGQCEIPCVPVGRGLAPAAISHTYNKCAARPEAGLAHGNQQGERGLQISEAKPFPLACLSSDSFRTNGKNRPPEGWTSRRIPPGQPGRLAAPAGENDTCKKRHAFPARGAGPYARRRETRLDFFRYRYSGTPRTYKTAASPAPTSAASSAKPCQNAAGV